MSCAQQQLQFSHFHIKALMQMKKFSNGVICILCIYLSVCEPQQRALTASSRWCWKQTALRCRTPQCDRLDWSLTRQIQPPIKLAFVRFMVMFRNSLPVSDIKIYSTETHPPTAKYTHTNIHCPQTKPSLSHLPVEMYLCTPCLWILHLIVSIHCF